MVPRRNQRARLLHWLSLTLLLGFAAPSSALALTTQDLSGPLEPADLAASLAGVGVTVSNATFTGADIAGGSFADGQAAVGFDTGVLLSSGAISGVIGPNASDLTTTSNGTPGDPDLTTLAGFPTNDAAILAFDFVPTSDEIAISYVFSSDEYNEFANTTFNDVFGFFVNGNNCALVPSTAQPVSVNTINGGNPFGTNAQNPQFFRNNDLDDGGGSIPTEMDGLTTVLTCTAGVNPDVTNTMRLGIADVSDLLRDSNVFLQAGSLTTAPACSDGIDNDADDLVDFPADTGCSSDADTTETATYDIPGGGGGVGGPGGSPGGGPGGGGGGGAGGGGLTPPTLGETFNIELIHGDVTVASGSGPQLGTRARAAQKGRTFVPLTEARQLTVGSFVDTREGTVGISTAVDSTNKTQFGRFGGGLFQVLQDNQENALAVMRLKGGSFRNCRVGTVGGKRASAARRRLSRRTVRKLRGDADGAYQTRGRHSAATVRGTYWTTVDRCDGTLTTVNRGSVTVRDFRRKRTITLRTDKRYLARAPR